MNVVQQICDSNGGWSWIQTTFTVTSATTGQTTTVELGVTQTGIGLAYTSPNGTVLDPALLGELGATPLAGNGIVFTGAYATAPTNGCPPGANCTIGGNANVGMCGTSGSSPGCVYQYVIVPFLNKVGNFAGCMGAQIGWSAAKGAAATSASAAVTTGVVTFLTGTAPVTVPVAAGIGGVAGGVGGASSGAVSGIQNCTF